MLDIYTGQILLTFDSSRISRAECAKSLSESAHGEESSFFTAVLFMSGSEFESLILLTTERIREERR